MTKKHIHNKFQNATIWKENLYQIEKRKYNKFHAFSNKLELGGLNNQFFKKMTAPKFSIQTQNTFQKMYLFVCDLKKIERNKVNVLVLVNAKRTFYRLYLVIILKLL